MTKQLFLACAAAATLAACQQTEPDVVEIDDPMAAELANATPIDPNSVPMMLDTDDYRCSGSNALLKVDYIRTGEDLSVRVTPAGGAGVTLPETSSGTFSDENNSLSGTPSGDTVTFNGATCRR